MVLNSQAQVESFTEFAREGEPRLRPDVEHSLAAPSDPTARTAVPEPSLDRARPAGRAEPVVTKPADRSSVDEGIRARVTGEPTPSSIQP